MTPDEEWSEMVAPYQAAATALGYRLLDTSRWTSNEYPTLTSFNHFWFDGEATFLDLGATIARGAAPRGAVLGFNYVQFLTRVSRLPDPTWVLTNGQPPGYPQGNIPIFLRWLTKRLPDSLKSLPMRNAEDLPLVLARHREAIQVYGGSPIAPDPEQPLEWRWAIMKKEEDEA